MKYIYFLLLLAFVASCGKSGSGSDSDKPVLLVSLEPQRKMLEEIAGTHYDIQTLLPPGTNPETFEPSVAQRMRAAGCVAYFPIGFMPFESSFSATLPAGVKAFDTRQGIEYITDTHNHGNAQHSVPDPHIWTSFRNSQAIAANMARALALLDPEHADEYISRGQALAHRLDSLDISIAERLPRGLAFAVWHPSLSYFARDYGLEQIAVGQESKEVSAKALKHIIDHARQDSVRVFFFQREYDSRQAESINQEIGSHMVAIDPLAYEWETELIRIANELSY